MPLNRISLLSQIVVDGSDGRPALPPLRFNYSKFEPLDRRYQALQGVDRGSPGVSLADPNAELVDLFGRGLPDIVHMDGLVRYWRNLGNGGFDAPRTMEGTPPQARLSNPGVELLDANGEGRADLVVGNGSFSGYYPLTFSGARNRAGFVRYHQSPPVALDSPDVRLIDLDGEERGDALEQVPIAFFNLLHQILPSPSGG